MNAETGLGNCFSGGCEAKFNLFTFIRAHVGGNNGDTINHIEAVAKELGWRPRKRVELAVEMDKGDLKLPDSMPLPINGRNLRYLEERRISLDLARHFHLRYSHDGGFFYKDPSGKWRRQDYSKRIIIPVFNLDAELVSFQGRDITGAATNKYLFPPGYAAAGRYLFDAHNVRGSKSVVIGEGVFDVMAIRSALDEECSLREVGAIGTFGKHLSDEQLMMLLTLKERGLEEVVFMWDGEPRAIQDACETAQRVSKLGLRCRIAILPPGKDPNEVAPSVVREAYWTAKVATLETLVKLKMTFALKAAQGSL
ncbi:toprim domain-containing protein [Ectothiorhodospira shaposhnikovii]|uniref:toprim domain-containing protein n=1 Tax=Ectothiorhodospira shaposhnikovii TaxID=1054 RepID=UPI001EE9715F|nr:toprim domain-containing protein [Ectothiorhodospira shaposhnikovii]MCG5512878.1 toprim domain-containing protein [Ectothiorhodospira shaposhnikovii]